MKLWVFDIDGTVANDSDRETENYLKWAIENYLALPPYPTMIQLIREIEAAEETLIFLTGRQESFRKVTEMWLRVHLPAFTPWTLYMREEGSPPEGIAEFKVQVLETLCRDNPGREIRFYEDNVWNVEKVFAAKLPISIHLCKDGSVIKTL